MAARLRDFFETAFALYPDEAKLDLKNRFMSPRPEMHLGALVELITFAILKKSGHEVEVHPEIQGTDARPDFRIHLSSGTVLIECTTANPSVETAKADSRRFEAVDSLEKIVSNEWSVGYVSQETGPNPLRSAQFIRAVRSWLSTLDHQEVTTGLEAGDELPTYEWRGEGWVILLQAIPLKPEAEPMGARGMYMSEVTRVDERDRIRR